MTQNRKVAFFVWLLLLVWGAIAVVQRFSSGHVLANYGSYVPWGLWVAGYVYLAGLSAGAFLISVLSFAFGVKRVQPVARLALFTALVAIVMALLCIFFDLGHSFRAWEVITRPNFHSMMAWMIWLYTAYVILLIAQFRMVVRHDPRDASRIRTLAWVGIPLAIAFSGGVGALFGTVIGLPLWHSPLYPILFLTGGALSGSAFVTAIVALGWGRDTEGWADRVRLFGRITLGLALAYFLLEWAEFSVPMWYAIGPEYEQLKGVLFGRFWYVFWVVHALLGVIVPVLVLVRRPTEPRAVGVASLLVAASFLAVRLNLVIPAQVTPRLSGLEQSYRDLRLSFDYVPSVFEWQLLAFVFAVGIAVFYAGTRLLPLAATDGEVQP